MHLNLWESDWMRFDALTHTHSHFACKASFESISSRRINVSTSEHVMSCFDFLMISFYFAYCCGVWCCGRGRRGSWRLCLNDGFSHGIRVRFACAQQRWTTEKWKMNIKIWARDRKTVPFGLTTISMSRMQKKQTFDPFMKCTAKWIILATFAD